MRLIRIENTFIDMSEFQRVYIEGETVVVRYKDGTSTTFTPNPPSTVQRVFEDLWKLFNENAPYA